jgi:hypothetical protein
VFLAVDLEGSFVRPHRIPSTDAQEGDASFFNETIVPDVVSIRSGAKSMSVVQSGHGSSRFACWSEGGAAIAFVDVRESASPGPDHVMTLHSGSVSRVVHAAGAKWLVEDGTTKRISVLDEESGLLVGISQAGPLLDVSSVCWWSTALLSSSLSLILQCDPSALLRSEPGASFPVSAFPTFADEGIVTNAVWLGVSKLVLLSLKAPPPHSVEHLVLVDPISLRMRRLVLDQTEDEGSALASACELQDGRVFVLRANGSASVYEVESARLDESEAKWRILAGLPPSNAADDSQGRSDQGLVLRVGDTNIEGEKKESRSKKQGGGGGGGSGSGGRSGGGGSGSGDQSGGNGNGTNGTEGVGSGGRSGIKREGDGGPPVEEGLMNREISEAQRQMARRGLEEELAAIDMGRFDLEEYRRIVASVANETEQLKSVLKAVEARGKERVWLNRKTSGDLDDTRLVESIVGESNVFKRRGVNKPKPFGPQEKPKRLCFVLDLSASMYRFNTQDQRLAREIELAVLVMEALDDPELHQKYHYTIIGHSGDDSVIDLGVAYGNPPKVKNGIVSSFKTWLISFSLRVPRNVMLSSRKCLRILSIANPATTQWKLQNVQSRMSSSRRPTIILFLL